MSSSHGEENRIRYVMFTDRSMEDRFFQEYIQQVSGFLRWILIVTSIVFLSMSLMDTQFLPARYIVPVSMIRVSISLCSLAFSFVIHKWKDIWSYSIILGMMGIGASSLTMWTSTLYAADTAPHLLLMGLVVILLVQFFIHISWIAANISAASSILLFLLLGADGLRTQDPLPLVFSIGYLVFFSLSFSFLSFMLGTYRHREYLDRVRLVQLSNTDPLTGIYNRTKFDEILERLPAMRKNLGQKGAIAFLDLDDFKKINDLLGHVAGDKVILHVVRLVKEHIRSRDVFCRWGGEEFTILFPETALEDAVAICERIRAMIEQADVGYEGGITVSFGVTTFHEEDTVHSFVGRADKLLYKAKTSGKNQCVWQ